MTSDLTAPPKTTSKGFIPLQYVLENKKTILNKVLIEFKDRCLFADGRKVQGFVTNEKIAEIKGEHYTYLNLATQIRSTRRVEGTFFDNYAYFAEPGLLNRFNEDKIKKTIGCESAEAKLKILIIVPIDRVWIKTEKYRPVKFAIQKGLKDHDIRDIEIDEKYKRS